MVLFLWWKVFSPIGPRHMVMITLLDSFMAVTVSFTKEHNAYLQEVTVWLHFFK